MKFLINIFDRYLKTIISFEIILSLLKKNDRKILTN